MRRAGKVMTLAALIVLLPIGTAALFGYLMFGDACDRIETVLAKDDKGRSVTATFEACTVIGTTVSEWLDLVSPSGHHHTFLKFWPEASSEPSATWVGDRDLQITISAVSGIIDKQIEIDGVHITYDIGRDLSK
jgi:hypothetical protein